MPRFLLLFPVLLLAAPLVCGQPPADPPAQGRLAEEVDAQIMRLVASDATARAAARERLLELAGASPQRAERVLDLLPTADDPLPPALATQVNDLRVAIEKQLAESAIQPSLVTIDVTDSTLSSVLAAIELQTGNKLLDNRDQFGQEVKEQAVSLHVKDQPFWRVVDQVLDQSGMDVYPYSGENALALVNSDPGRQKRSDAASYAGPFRVAASSITANRDLRREEQKSMTVELELAWEPRLRPIALAQTLADVVATNESGERLALQPTQEAIELELSMGNQATELRLPFELPPRETHSIASLRGTLMVLAPGREAEFRFDNLKADAKPVTKRVGGVTVTLAGVRKNGAVWEVHMRMRLDQAGEALASHRGWVFDNRTFLVDKNGEEIDHAGFETNMQTAEEIGLAYLFDHEPGIEGLTWVYRTPSSIHRFPVEYELKDLPLP